MSIKFLFFYRISSQSLPSKKGKMEEKRREKRLTFCMFTKISTLHTKISKCMSKVFLRKTTTEYTEYNLCSGSQGKGFLMGMSFVQFISKRNQPDKFIISGIQSCRLYLQNIIHRHLFYGWFFRPLDCLTRMFMP